MDELVVDGEKYISSKRAARLSGYAKDYIGQLCRAGKIEAKMVGRSWYVKESAIKDHRKTFQGEPVIDDKLWAEGKNGLEFKGFGASVPPPKAPLSEEHVKINYEPDVRPLIPAPEKKEISVAEAPEAVSIPLKKTFEEDVVRYPEEEPKFDAVEVLPEEKPEPVRTVIRPEPPMAEKERDEVLKEDVREVRPSRRGGYKLKLAIVVFFVLLALLMLLESRVSYQATPQGFEKVDSGIAPLSLVGDIRARLSR